MSMTIGASERIVLAMIVLLGLFALPAQLYLAIDNRQTGIGESVIRFFSYFTILTNILVFISSIVLLTRAGGKLGAFFGNASTRTAIAVYIALVGIIYNAILAAQWNPTGLQRIVDQVLHTVIPTMYVICWVVYIRRYHLPWRQMIPWMTYPLVYCVYTLLRGPLAGFYPYPFIDVIKLGYTQVFTNIVGVVIALLFVSGVFIAATRIHTSSTRRQEN